MADSTQAILKLFRPGIEGRYSNILSDRGGETYCGISRNNFPGWSGWKQVDFFKGLHLDLNGNNLFNIVLNDLQKFYTDNFWKRIWGNEINNQSFAEFFFSCSVNLGVNRSIKLLQQTLGVAVDGVMGINTLSKINSSDPALLGKYAQNIRTFYKSIAVGSQEYFLKGWLNRVAAYVTLDGNAVA